MADCPIYEKIEITEKQKFWSEFFKNSIDDEGELSFELYTDGVKQECPALNFFNNKIKDLINPNYEFYELVRRILKLYMEANSCSSFLASSSSNYQNCLHVLAAITDCANHQELEIWEQKFNAKYPII